MFTHISLLFFWMWCLTGREAGGDGGCTVGTVGVAGTWLDVGGVFGGSLTVGRGGGQDMGVEGVSVT